MMKNIVIFDLDGTLALIDHRRHLVEKEVAFVKWFNALDAEVQQEYQRNFSQEKLRIHFVDSNGWKPDWDAFFEACDKDQPNHGVIEMYRFLMSHYRVYVFSGRSNAVEEKTLSWFYANEIPIPHVFRMRPDKDYTPDEQLKAKWLEEVGVDNVFCVFDDRQKVVDMWRSKGITCFQVAPGNF